jgi:hypothetical protein
VVNENDPLPVVLGIHVVERNPTSLLAVRVVTTVGRARSASSRSSGGG